MSSSYPPTYGLYYGDSSGIIYAVHPSNSVTSMQIATAYGLSLGEYIVVNDPQPGFLHHQYINLYPRDDLKYPSIKYELGDERDGVQRYIGGNLWKEVKQAVERKRLTHEDKY